jgi:hypothetical protein
LAKSLSLKSRRERRIKYDPPVAWLMLPLSNFSKRPRHFRATMTAQVQKSELGYAAALFCALSTSAEAL